MEKFCSWFPCLGKISTQPYTFILHARFNCIQINCLCEKVWDCCLYMVLWWNPSTSSDGFLMLLLAAPYPSTTQFLHYTGSLTLECKEVCVHDQFLENLDFSHTFSVIWQYQNYRKCMGKLRFSKNWSWTTMHSRFSLLFLWIHKLHFSKRKWQIYVFKKN